MATKNQPPAHFICPLTMDLMHIPVVHAKTGSTFEREAIMNWIYQGNPTCPLTRLPLHPSDFTLNVPLQESIAEWKRKISFPEEEDKTYCSKEDDDAESKQSQRSQRDNKQQQQQSSFRSNKQNNAPSAIPEQPKTTAPAPLDSDKLDRRIKSIRNDFVFGKNVEELLLSIDEISGTSDYGLTFVTKNADRMFDCKEAECQGIAEMFKVVCEKGKIKKDDLRNGLMDSIEFIDSILCDCPKAFDIMGEVVAILLNLKALDVQWLCEQCEKTKVDPDTQAPEKLVRSTIVRASADVKTMFSKSGGALNSLLGADKWRQISAELLA